MQGLARRERADSIDVANRFPKNRHRWIISGAAERDTAAVRDRLTELRGRLALERRDASRRLARRTA
jgi:hypothetical protein